MCPGIRSGIFSLLLLICFWNDSRFKLLRLRWREISASTLNGLCMLTIVDNVYVYVYSIHSLMHWMLVIFQKLHISTNNNYRAEHIWKGFATQPKPRGWFAICTEAQSILCFAIWNMMPMNATSIRELRRLHWKQSIQLNDSGDVQLYLSQRKNIKCRFSSFLIKVDRSELGAYRMPMYITHIEPVHVFQLIIYHLVDWRGIFNVAYVQDILRSMLHQRIISPSDELERQRLIDDISECLLFVSKFVYWKLSRI